MRRSVLRNGRSWLIAILAVALLMGGSGPSSSAQTSSQVVVGQGGDPPSMDPHKSRGPFGGNILFNLFDGLTRFDSEGQLHPALATSWRSVNNTTWQFSLRRGVKFHNGAEFSAEAVVFNFKRLFEPNVHRLNTEFRNIERIDVLDRYTINIVTKGADPVLPQRVTELLISEPGHTQRVGEEGMSREAAGTGPYRLVEWRTNQQVVLQAFADYWGGKPKVDRLIFRTIPEESTRIAELLTGRVDIISDVPPEQVRAINANPRLRIESRPSKRVPFVGLNLLDWGPRPLKDVRVRQALNYAVNVPEILRTIYQGLGRQTATVFRADYFGYDASIEPYPHDPAKARELLAAAGYPNGFEVNLLTSEQIILKGVELAQAIAGQLRRAGIRAEVKPLALATYRNTVIGGQEQQKNEGLYVWNWGTSLSDPDSPLSGFLHSKGISSFYRNSELDALIEKGRVTLNQEERRRVYREVQLLLKREAPVIFLFQAPDIWGVNERVVWKARQDQNVLGRDMNLK